MTTYAPGAPCWFDLGSPDVPASVAFYTALFGWTTAGAAEPEAGDYTSFLRDGDMVAAVASHQIDTPYHTDEDMPAIWTTYFATEDAEATTSRAESAGGKIVLNPMDVMGYGRMAVYLDRTGAAFAVWQRGLMSGADVTGQAGSVAWVELSTSDSEAAVEFYREVLDLGTGGAAYRTWQAGDAAVAGLTSTEDTALGNGLPAYWTVYFGVADCAATVAEATRLGGSVVVPPADSEIGRRAVLRDPHGAFFGVLEPGQTPA